MYTTNKLRLPSGGFYPFVGMHSMGEAVKLLQKEPWQPSKEDEVGKERLGQNVKMNRYINKYVADNREKKKHQNDQMWADLGVNLRLHHHSEYDFFCIAFWREETFDWCTVSGGFIEKLHKGKECVC